VTDFEIRKASGHDRGRIIALVSKMWGEDITARYQWQYLSNPHGKALTWLAIEKATGETVGCTSIFPRRVFVDGTKRMGSIGGDCYIEPRARRRGLATALHRKSLSEMRSFGVDFMYGPPNPNNLSALIKAGAHVVANFKRWVRPLTGRAVYRAAFGSSPSKFEAHIAGLPIMMLDRLTRTHPLGLKLDQIAHFGPEFDSLFERAAPATGILCLRDSAYLEWRYLAAPAHLQIPFAVKSGSEIVGLMALEIMGEQATIIDLLTLTDSRLIDDTLQLILDQVSAAGCSSLEVNCMSECALVSRLRRLGFIGRSERGFQVAVSDQDTQIETLLSAGAWNFMVADQDMDTFFSELPE